MKKQILVLAFVFLLALSLQFVSALTVERVDVSPTEIEPGETALIDITLKNNLNEDVKDISVSLDLSAVPLAPFDSSNEETIQEIREDKNKKVSFRVKALTDAESGIYKIPIKISYIDQDEEQHEKTSLISVSVNSPPKIGVEREDGLLLKGQKNELVVKIVNKGLSDVKFLDIEIEHSNYYSLLSQKQIYIGDIDSDDFETISFDVFFKEDAPSLVNLPVSLTYRDVSNNEYTEDFTISMNVYSRERALQLGLIQKSNTVTYITIVVVLVILWFVYRKWKKRRQRKKAEAAGK